MTKVECTIEGVGNGGKTLIISHRERSGSSPRVKLNETSLTRLNLFFSELCQDEHYVEPVNANVNTPEVTEMQVWNTIRRINDGSGWHSLLDLERPCRNIYRSNY